MLVYGKQTIKYLIDKHSDRIKTLFIAKDIDKKEFSSYNRKNFILKRIPKDAANALCKNSNHQGYLALCDDLDIYKLADLKENSFILILYSLNDMGNIGAITRSAYAFGVDTIIISGLRDINFSTVIRTSSGAGFDMKFCISYNILDTIHHLKSYGFSIYGACLDGEDINKVSIEEKRVLILGNEANGISKRALAKLDNKVCIKFKRRFNSLNVSCAGAILMDKMK